MPADDEKGGIAKNEVTRIFVVQAQSGARRGGPRGGGGIGAAAPGSTL